MKKVIIFGGTTEGKQLAQTLESMQISCLYCVATDYGKQQLEESEYIKIRSGRMDGEQMCLLFQKETPEAVVDATHPYAEIVKQELDRALEKYGDVPFFRVLRDEEKQGDSNCVFFDSAMDCAKALEHTKGKIFLTTGSKDLPVFCSNPFVRERIVARVIPGEESIRLCNENGLKGNQMIAMQGPFSMEMNYAFLQETGSEILVMKEGGKSGGETERIEAAKKANVVCYIIKRPKTEQKGESLSKVTEDILHLFGIKAEAKKMNVTLAGFGMGEGSVTEEVRQCVRQADYVVGASRMISCVEDNKETYPYYLAKDILPKLREIMNQKMSCVQNAVVLLSGDSGFYSGAKKLKEALEKEEGISVTVLPGISSVSAMAARIGESWEDAKLFSTHGVEEREWMASIASFVCSCEKTFVITSGSGDVRSIGTILKDLEKRGELSFSVVAGMNLYANEKLYHLTVDQCVSFDEEGLCILFIKNLSPKKRRLTPGLCDGEFERSQVPMSKEEVRALSICKLGVTEHAVCYDIGSGSGSVAVELGLLDPGVKVYAIECEPDAFELTGKNIEKFGLKNVWQVQGKAPEALESLPAPTHVFIGGSGGNLKEILEALMNYKRKIKVVINAVTLETVAQIQGLVQSFGFTHVDVVQLNVSKAKQVGDYHLMQGQNPVYIATFTISEDSMEKP